MIWWLKNELEDVHEYEADDWVLRKGFDAKTYQLMLLKRVAGLKYYTVVNNFNRNSLKKRIVMMQSQKSAPWSIMKCMFILPVAFMAVTAFARPETIAFSQDFGQVSIASLHKALPGLSEPSELLISHPDDNKVRTYPSPRMNDDGVYQQVDEQPRFPGELLGIIEYLKQNVRYPE